MSWASASLACPKLSSSVSKACNPGKSLRELQLHIYPTKSDNANWIMQLYNLLNSKWTTTMYCYRVAQSVYKVSINLPANHRCLWCTKSPTCFKASMMRERVSSLAPGKVKLLPISIDPMPQAIQKTGRLIHPFIHAWSWGWGKGNGSKSNWWKFVMSTLWVILSHFMDRVYALCLAADVLGNYLNLATAVKCKHSIPLQPIKYQVCTYHR